MSETIAYINSVEKEDKKMSHLVGIGLVLGFLLPHTSTAFLLVNPLLCLFYQSFRQNRVYYKRNWLVLVPIFLTLLVNLPQGISTKAVMSCVTILLFFACFPMVGKVKIPVFYFYLILSVIFLTQLAYLLNINFLVRFLDTYYPISDKDAFYYGHMKSVITRENMMSFRLGGLYRNPNQCSRSLTFLLAAFLVFNRKKPLLWLLPFVVISFYGVLLTGSRTGFVVVSLVITVFLFVNNKINARVRYLIVFAFVVGFIYLTTTGSTFRGLDITDTGSSDLKANTFAYYLSTENSIYKLLFGYLDSEKFVSSTIGVMNYFDADYGYIVFQYGFVGLFSVLVYFYSIFRRTKKEGWCFFVLLLWMITSTIVTSYRALFVFMLLLSVVYNDNRREEFSPININKQTIT